MHGRTGSVRRACSAALPAPRTGPPQCWRLPGGDNDAMSDESQIVVPPSFIALFVLPGRSKPSASREEIAARYEFCEDLATMLTEHASAKLWELGVAESDVLERIERGLLAGDAVVTPAEAQWVVRRLAELLHWDAPLPGQS